MRLQNDAEVENHLTSVMEAAGLPLYCEDPIKHLPKLLAQKLSHTHTLCVTNHYLFSVNFLHCLRLSRTYVQAKGSDAAITTGTEAAVYASEASDSNDLLDEVLPVTVSDYVDLVKAHLSAGPNYRFASRQLLLLGAMLDFSDTTNRKVASSFLHELLIRPLDYELDDDENKIIIGDGISLGGDKDWQRAVSELARKVHASVGEFETVVTSVIEELACPCRERTADVIQWMHCLSVTGLLLENIESLRSLHGKAIEPSEILHSLLLPGAKQVHADVQRVATRCLCLFGLREKKPCEDVVKQLRLSFINGAIPVSPMACKALIDLVTWHGPEEVDKAIGLDLQNSSGDEKNRFVPVNLTDSKDDLSIGVLDLLYSGFDREDCDATIEADDQESIRSILGEGFAKFLLLSDNYPTISSCLHPLILCKLVTLYFSDEANGLQRLKQCLSVFFEHYPALSHNHKKCVSRAFIPVMKSMWPGICCNPGGASVVVSRLRKRAFQASRFMLQMMQIPLFSNEIEEQQSSENRTESPPTSEERSLDFESGEEGLAIQIAAEVVSFPEKKTPAEKSYILTLCRVAALVQFRPSEQEAIKCMRGLLNGMIIAASSDKELVKELNRMATRLKSLDKHPDEELSHEKATAIFGKLGLDENPKMDTLTTVLPPTPAPRSTRAAPSRRRARREASSDEDEEEEASFPPAVPMTPSIVSMRSQRASKTMAMSKMTAKTKIEFSDEEIPEESDVTSEDASDEACDDMS
ncbi:condensin complex subunit 3-like [Asparagus officinalis]|uniref:condensin complex subunit 3-like n=1 Tax=Asparagus officinalis TaxID=4686 RepID=UPI00098E3E63|nr:condensin complex subunit 3-like [Asparagus officinalis]